MGSRPCDPMASPLPRTTGATARTPGRARSRAAVSAASATGRPGRELQTRRSGSPLRIFSCISSKSPVMTPWAMMRAATPTATPRTEITVIRETKVCLRLARM
jgi:hypothetical protein